MKLENRVAIITGGAGMGFGAAKVMGGYGAKIVLISQSAKVFERVEALKEMGIEASGYQADVRDYAAVEESVKKVFEKYGKIDVLVTAAGLGGATMSDFTDDDAFEVRDLAMSVAVNGAWNACRAVIPYMKEAKYGKIVTFSSVTGPVVTDPGMIGYATSKAAILGFTKALAMEYAHLNITANTILPGSIDTPLLTTMIEKQIPGIDPELVKHAMGGNIPMRRLGTIEEAGELVAFLASDESSYITGTSIVIDGGNTVPETPPDAWDPKYGGPEDNHLF